jgi:hypothetical protein
VRPIGNSLVLSAGMDGDELQVNCGRCGKSIIVRSDDILDKRLVECADCERVPPRNAPRPVRHKLPDF